MIRGYVLIILLVIVTCVESSTECRHDHECGSDECCYYHEGPLIVSKRSAVLPTFISHQGGWCEKYLTLGAQCNPFDKLNGHCSCGPNLSCRYFPYPTPGTKLRLEQRSLRPGNYMCHPN